MLFSDSYFTAIKSSVALYKDRGSKFYGHCFPVRTESEVKQLITDLKQEHPSATHYCFAYRLGAEKQNFRMSDDGEPSGTAGKQIYGQIQSNDLSNVLIVVIRYFGGTQLGIPGLIQAYKTAAAECIAQAGVKEQFILFEYNVSFAMEETSAVMRLLKEKEARIISSAYCETNNLVFQIKKQHAQQLEQAAKELYKITLQFKSTV